MLLIFLMKANHTHLELQYSIQHQGTGQVSYSRTNRMSSRWSHRNHNSYWSSLCWDTFNKNKLKDVRWHVWYISSSAHIFVTVYEVQVQRACLLTRLYIPISPYSVARYKSLLGSSHSSSTDTSLTLNTLSTSAKDKV